MAIEGAAMTSKMNKGKAVRIMVRLQWQAKWGQMGVFLRAKEDRQRTGLVESWRDAGECGQVSPAKIKIIRL